MRTWSIRGIDDYRSEDWVEVTGVIMVDDPGALVQPLQLGMGQADELVYSSPRDREVMAQVGLGTDSIALPALSPRVPVGGVEISGLDMVRESLGVTGVSPQLDVAESLEAVLQGLLKGAGSAALLRLVVWLLQRFGWKVLAAALVAAGIVFLATRDGGEDKYGVYYGRKLVGYSEGEVKPSRGVKLWAKPLGESGLETLKYGG